MENAADERGKAMLGKKLSEVKVDDHGTADMSLRVGHNAPALPKAMG